MLCTGASLLLSVTPDPGTIVEWQDGSSLSIYTVTSAGFYSVLQSNFCGDDSDSIEVDFQNPPLSFDLGPDTILCPGESIVLHAPQTTDAMLWQDGTAVPSFIADQAQTYSLQISNACGISADELTLSFDTHQPVISLTPELQLCPGSMVTLDATQIFPALYTWSTGSISPLITVTTPGYYSVTVESICFTTTEGVDISVANDCNSSTIFFIPNIFSPNGDDINDVFSIFFNPEAQVTGLQGSIFDRWGNMVFSSDAIPFIWTGDFKGEDLNPGVFVYVFRITYLDQAIEVTEIVHGDVTLVR